MTDEEKLYTLMAQAEGLQTHAAKLQNEAKETFSALPLAVEQAGQKIRSMGLQMALIMLTVGIVVSAIAVAGVWRGISGLRDEARTSCRSENFRGTGKKIQRKSRESGSFKLWRKWKNTSLCPRG